MTRRGLGVVAGLVMAAALAAVAGAAECKPPLAATPVTDDDGWLPPPSRVWARP